MKTRVLIHSMTFKRDFGFAYCLSKVLEALGCETFVCSNTDYVSLPMRLWKPHVVFYITVGRSKYIRQHHPQSRMVLWNAESCYMDTPPPPELFLSSELPIAGDKDLYEHISKVLIWGKSTKDMLLDNARKNSWSWILDRPEEFDRKFTIVGHPRVDLARFGDRPRKNKDKVKIGFIGICSTLNAIKHSCVELLFDIYDRKVQFDVKEDIYYEAKFCDLISFLIHRLGTEKYEFNLRPYPLENLQNYMNSSVIRSKSLMLDESIEFSSWVREQDIIIGSVSTTMYLVAAAQKPYINVDKLFNRYEGLRFYSKDYLAAIPEHCPESQDELFKMIENYQDHKLIAKKGTTLDRQLTEYMSGNGNLPATFQIAKEIINVAKGHCSNGLPTGICSMLHEAYLEYADFRGMNRKSDDYSHFNLRKIRRAVEDEFNNVVEDIIKAIPPEQIAEFNRKSAE